MSLVATMVPSESEPLERCCHKTYLLFQLDDSSLQSLSAAAADEPLSHALHSATNAALQQTLAVM
jgi:hypothetical protein